MPHYPKGYATMPHYPKPSPADWHTAPDAARLAFLLWLAFERGRAGCTFATRDERATPGYGAAWAAGATAR